MVGEQHSKRQRRREAHESVNTSSWSDFSSITRFRRDCAQSFQYRIFKKLQWYTEEKSSLSCMPARGIMTSFDSDQAAGYCSLACSASVSDATDVAITVTVEVVVENIGL